MLNPMYVYNGGRAIIRSDGVPMAVIARQSKRGINDMEVFAKTVCRLLNQEPYTEAIETATNDLIHTLGNFLGIVTNNRQEREAGRPIMMSDAEVGRFAMEREPKLREALDNLRAAIARAKIEEEE